MIIFRSVCFLAIVTLFTMQFSAQNETDEDNEKSVEKELAELAEKSKSRPGMEKLRDANARARKELIESEILKTALNVGEMMPSFELGDAFDRKMRSERLLEKGHVILVFYRGAWCPFCNLYLRGLQRNLAKFTRQGAQLVAISVEPPDRALAVAQKNKLDFTVLSDPNLNVSRKFGIVFELPKVADDVYKEYGFDLAEYNKMKKSELPIPATYVVNKNGTVEFAFLEVDYRKRAAPSDLLKVLYRINGSKTNGKSEKTKPCKPVKQN